MPVRSSTRAASGTIFNSDLNGASQALDDIVWNVNTFSESVEEITFRMRRYAGEVLDPGRVRYDFQFRSKRGEPGTGRYCLERKYFQRIRGGNYVSHAQVCR